MKADKVESFVSNDEFMTGAMFSVLAPEGYPVSYWLFGRPEPVEEVDDEPPYTEHDDQAWSTYGGIERLELGRDSLRLSFDETAAADLKSEREVVIRFDITNEQFDQLKQAFDSMFRDHANYRVS